MWLGQTNRLVRVDAEELKAPQVVNHCSGGNSERRWSCPWHSGSSRQLNKSQDALVSVYLVKLQWCKDNLWLGQTNRLVRVDAEEIPTRGQAIMMNL